MKSHLEKILDYLDERGKITPAQAAQILGVPESDAKQVLDELTLGQYVTHAGDYYYYHEPGSRDNN